MKAKRSSAKRVTRAAIAALVLTMLVLFWPAQLGGQVSLLSTVGSSMHPNIREGDLAIVRHKATYEVGEVVAYRNAELRQIALHRIIGVNGERFQLKGDNNNWIDSYEPVADEIVGRLWVLLPKGGKWLDWLRRPRDAALVTALLGLLLGTGIRQTRKRMRRRRAGEPVRGAGLKRPARVREHKPAAPGARMGQSPRGLWLRVAIAGAVLLALGGGATVWASGQPALTPDIELVEYSHAGEFHYQAPTSVSNDILTGSGMRDGTPVYLRLTDRLDTRFSYELQGEQVERVRGVQRLRALLSDTRGWQRELPMRAPATFEGGSFAVDGGIDLIAMQQLIQRFQDQTGVGGNIFQLRIIAEAEIEAVIAGQDVRETFAPELVFTVDANAMTLDPGDGDPLKPVQNNSVQRDVMRPNRLKALGRSMPVTSLQQAGRALSSSGALILLVAALALWRAPKERPSEMVARRYSSRLLDVDRVEPRPDERLVRMSSVRDLMRVADNLEAPVLHLVDGSLHRYLVQEGSTTFVVELDDALGSETAAKLGRLPAPLGLPVGPPTHKDKLRLPQPVLEIDLGESLPPAPIGTPRPLSGQQPGPAGMQLPPAPPRRSP